MIRSGSLVISAGMPRAGSGWYYNLMHDLVVASGGRDTRQIRREYHLSWLLTEVNCNLSTLSTVRLLPVLLPALSGERFVIKTHAGATELVRWLIRHRKIFVAYIYRDPRAALLSAYEYGTRARAQSRQNAFAQLATIDEAVIYYKKYLKIWESWHKIPEVLITRYENLMQDYEQETVRLMDFLNIDAGASQVNEVIEKYSPEHGSPALKGIHFGHGEAERFRRVLSPEQLARITQAFGESLVVMGYKL
mgnify:CR=1 FL=1